MTGGVSLDVSVGTPGAALSGALDLCDRLLGEIGRRQHRFAWLRAPGSGGQEWLAVDAYYPGNRVVICLDPKPEARALCAQLVPAHGFHLVSFDPAELSPNLAADARGMRERLERSGWSPRAVQAPLPPPPTVEPDPAPAARRSSAAAERFGLVIGMALSAVVLLEAFFGAVVVGAERGHLVLGFGIILDAGARVFGTMTAAHDGEPGTAWGALILGSPIVATFQRAEASESARLAGVVATVALSVAALGAGLAVL